MTNQTEFQRLVQDYLEGRANADQVAQLNDRLREDAEARRLFREIMNLDSALHQASMRDANAPHPLPSLTDSSELTSSARSQNARVHPVRRWGVSILAVAATLLLAFCGLPWLMGPQQYATVEDAAGVRNLSTGDRVGREPYQIDTGTIELVTGRGARVVIEAPASFRFESEQCLRLNYGRLAADVPETAHGFTVLTSSGKAIDLGTKFGVDAPEAGEAEIHVFEGEVVAQSTDGGNLRNLRSGEAFRLQTVEGKVSAFRSAAFIQPGEVTSLDAALRAGQVERAHLATEKLRQDPSLIALLDFESSSRRPGVYRMVQGRWPGSQAAEFVNVGDHMKLDVGGDEPWPQLTLAAWVRLDHLGEPYQSLLHTDGWDDVNAGQVHWMVTRLMTMRLALRNNRLAPEASTKAGFPDSITDVSSEKGRWVHLAAVYDADEKIVRFFLNGQFDGETKLSVALPAKLGPAQIGNWNTNDRTLSGRIDEMLILGRAMDDEEVKALFESGNPYR